MAKLSFEESLKLCKKDIGKIYEISFNYLEDMNFVAWLLAENPDKQKFIKDSIKDIIGLDIEINMNEIAENLWDVHCLSLEMADDPGTQEHEEDVERYEEISYSAMELLEKSGYYEIVVPEYFRVDEEVEFETPLEQKRKEKSSLEEEEKELIAEKEELMAKEGQSIGEE